MSFIVKKNIKGKEYYYLRESKREDGKVKAVTVAYLGKNKKEAEEKAKEFKSKKKDIEMENKKGESKEQEKNEVKVVHIDLGVEELAGFCKRKGFVYASGEIYGGLSGFWDFGPLGVEMKNNLKKEWWKFHVHGREDIVGIDGSIITNPGVWKASGHVDSFVDVAVVCMKCKDKTKIDKFELGKVKCSKCGGEFESKGEFNPMFTTNVGPVKEDSLLAYLRPETAQLIFADFKLVQENSRLKLPFGIAQVGKSFRNEIAPRDFLFRSREFEQMEIEYFINPEKRVDCPYVKDVEGFELNVYSEEMQKDGKEPERMKIKEALEKGIIKLPWHAYWLATELSWFFDLGVNQDKFRIRQHLSEEKSHYATDTWDLEYNFPFGWKELQGIADRGNYDLTQHEEHSKKDLKIFDEESGKKVLPEVISEPSLGVERAFLVFLFDAYSKNQKGDIVLRLNPKLAPVKAAVFPLVKTDEKLVKLAKDIYVDLRKEFNIVHDISGSVGRRYARNDEMGTPFCITVDGDSVKNNDVTVRERDSTKQVRVKVDILGDTLRKLISGDLKFEGL
jgi:glycyl-tRNA synthetase